MSTATAPDRPALAGAWASGWRWHPFRPCGGGPVEPVPRPKPGPPALRETSAGGGPGAGRQHDVPPATRCTSCLAAAREQRGKRRHARVHLASHQEGSAAQYKPGVRSAGSDGTLDSFHPASRRERSMVAQISLRGLADVLVIRPELRPCSHCLANKRLQALSMPSAVQVVGRCSPTTAAAGASDVHLCRARQPS